MVLSTVTAVSQSTIESSLLLLQAAALS